MTVRTTSRLRGWVLYDANCSFCTATAARFRSILERRGFRMVPSGLWPELRLLTADGHTCGGADAVFYLARCIWWAWPVWALAQLPGMRRVSRIAYRWIAAHRYCVGACHLPASVVHLCVLMLLLCVSLPVFAQNEWVELPFSVDKQNNHVLVKLSMNGKEGTFLVDTGSTWTLADVKFLRLTVEIKKAQFDSVGAGGDGVGWTVDIKIPNRRWTGYRVYVMDLSAISKRYDVKIDGIIGQDFLRRYDNVIFDYKSKKLVLSKW